ncbi:PLP-dependent aminotransferase family protein [Pseudarthrobacter sp. fls2-241-R2A-168]|uniref:aminotransferase-like domain-containing protein n=1 Tax=Pseudarthrobacter sp. fls2-241-R2A-168 TaxID=3040304 RepID=UPI0025575FF1|nr:PLP-dependent aminotransferase family protein [Pseudarthrobacter sp. fls2-241-R2A-168]
MNYNLAARMERVKPSAIRDLLRYANDPDIVSFGGGYPDPTTFPIHEIGAIYADLAVPGNAGAFQYTVSDGLPKLRGQIAARMAADGTPTNMEEVLVLQGAQQGLDLVAKLLLDDGDVVITENPTFLGAMIAFAPMKPTYAAVDMDEDGMCTDALDAMLTANPRAKFIYTVPDFHNPTGITMTLERRRRLLEVAQKHDVIVVEDSPYRDLRYEGDAVPTIKSMDTDGRVIYLGSFSKILTPGLRLGWAAATPELIQNLGLLKLAADTQTSTINMAVASEFLDRYDLDAHVARVNVQYSAKRDLLLNVFDSAMPPGVTYTRPSGGLFTWLTLPEGFDAARFLLEEAIPHGRVAYVPGGPFYPDRAEPNHARLSFSSLERDEMVDAANRLGALITSAVDSGRFTKGKAA